METENYRIDDYAESKTGDHVSWHVIDKSSGKVVHAHKLYIDACNEIKHLQKFADFDIENYEFSDCNVVDIDSYENGVTIGVALSWEADGCLDLKKQDAIALAKHFKLTQEDLDDED